MSNIIASTIPDGATDPALVAIDAVYAVVTVTASGAIPVTQGLYAITKAGVAAMTLAQPVAGLPVAGGNDGQRIRVLDQGGHAHTITTASNGINGASHIATFGGTAGTMCDLIAYQGVWYTSGATGITLS